MIIDKFSFIPINITLITYLLFHGVTVPHYCYHEELSIAGNCRMCVVEVEKAPKPVVSCVANAFLLIKENSIFPNSVFVQKARENILEFLLVNHPLDCPVCDQGGDCDLQDQALYFGLTKRRFYKYKRVVVDIDLGSIVKTHFTRCIHCTRCVRFIKEVAGVGELGMLGRGVFSEVGTFIEKVLTTELAGNIIDLCPVARALIKKIIIHICSRPADCVMKACYLYAPRDCIMKACYLYER